MSSTDMDGEQLALFGLTDLSWEVLPEEAKKRVVDLFSQMIGDHLGRLSALYTEEECHER